MKKNIKDGLDSTNYFLIAFLVTLGVLIFVVTIVIPRFNYPKYEEVLYHCGSHFVKGTEVPNSKWDLERGVDVYYLYPDNWTIMHNKSGRILMQEWFENFNAVRLKKGEGGCKEILRFYEKK